MKNSLAHNLKNHLHFLLPRQLLWLLRLWLFPHQLTRNLLCPHRQECCTTRYPLHRRRIHKHLQPRSFSRLQVQLSLLIEENI